MKNPAKAMATALLPAPFAANACFDNQPAIRIANATGSGHSPSQVALFDAVARMCALLRLRDSMQAPEVLHGNDRMERLRPRRTAGGPQRRRAGVRRSAQARLRVAGRFRCRHRRQEIQRADHRVVRAGRVDRQAGGGRSQLSEETDRSLDVRMPGHGLLRFEWRCRLVRARQACAAGREAGLSVTKAVRLLNQNSANTPQHPCKSLNRKVTVTGTLLALFDHPPTPSPP